MARDSTGRAGRHLGTADASSVGCPGPTTEERSVDHRAGESIEWGEAPPEHFTGTVWFGPLSEGDEPTDLNALGVLFAPGARTDWHTHPGGQVLYVTSGAGLVQTNDGDTVVVGQGDVVYSPPGELHWHGATSDSYMMHLSLTTVGPTEWISRKVTDEEHRRR